MNTEKTISKKEIFGIERNMFGANSGTVLLYCFDIAPISMPLQNIIWKEVNDPEFQITIKFSPESPHIVITGPINELHSFARALQIDVNIFDI